MPFSAVGFNGETLNANNVNFSGTFSPTGEVTSDGQLLIGSTVAPNIKVGSLTSLDSSITITPGSGTIDLSASGMTPPDQLQIYYVAKSGNDANSGLNIENAKLTFGAAITAAVAMTPSVTNRFVIWCFDDGIYAENIITSPFVDIYAPNATIESNAGIAILIADNSSVTFYAMNLIVSSGDGVRKASTDTGSSWANISYINAGASVAFTNLAITGTLYCEWKTMYVGIGGGIGVLPAASGTYIIKGGDIIITGASSSGYGLFMSGGLIIGTLDRLICQGAGSTGGAIYMLKGKIDVSIKQIDANVAINIDGNLGSCVLNLFCNDISGSRSITNSAILNYWVPPVAMTDGQLIIGSTGVNPVVGSLTSIDSSVTITPGAGTIDLSASGAPLPNQLQIYYVAKNGNDANSGLNIENAVLTFGHAITLATAQTPSATNRFAIVCFDDGLYTEDLVGVAYVDIYAPNATIIGTVTALTVADNAHYTFQTIQVPDGAFGVLKGGTDTATSWATISEIICAGAGVGFANVSTTGVLMCEWKTLTIEDGVGVGDVTSAGHMHVKGGDIYITGITGSAIALGRALPGSIVGNVDHIVQIGSGTGTAIYMTQGIIDLSVNTINATTAYSIDGLAGSCVLNLFCNDLTGAEGVSNGALGNLWTPPTYPANQAGMLDGQLVIGSTGVNPVVGSLTSSDASVTITPGPGSIDLKATGGGGGGGPTEIFKARKNDGNQSISSGNEDLITFTTIDFQLGTAYNSGTSVFTTPVTGYYLICVSMNVIPGSSGDSGTVHLNGSQLLAFDVATSGANSWNGTTIPLSLTVGDTIAVYYYCAGGTAQIISGQSYWGMYQIQSGGGGSALVWNDIAAGSANMFPNNGYVADFGTLCTLTLPTTAAFGSIIEVVGKGAGGWQIAQNASQMIHINAATSTTGVTGYLSSNDQFNSVRLLCTVADLEFTVLSSEGTLNLN